jgi:hypothetical protein
MDFSLRLDRHRCARVALDKEEEEPMEKHNVVAADIAKAVFQVAVSEEPGRAARERRLSRGEFLTFFAQTPR